MSDSDSDVRIEAAGQGIGSGPSTGPAWHVRRGERPGQTLYYGHDLSRAVQIYERATGRRLAPQERKELGCEAIRLAQGSR